MKVYDYYNEEYGIKLRLELDKNGEELRYQCFSIGDEYRNNFYHEYVNGWDIASESMPAIDYDSGVLFLQGRSRGYDDCIVIVRNTGVYLKYDNNDIETYSNSINHIYGGMEETYDELVEMLNELGNNEEGRGLLFLDM